MTANGQPYGAIDPGALVIDDGHIAWVGPERALAGTVAGAELIDAEGRWVTPGLIDCHTHIVFAGSRAREFEMRLEGASYEAVAKAGGGILSTVRATREASLAELVSLALPRLDSLIAEGVTTLEVKSGYGLALEPELRQLEAARRLGDHRPCRIRTTLLAAHAIPPEHEADPDAYIEEIIATILPEAHEKGLADAVDAFCERIAFDVDQTRRMFAAAKELGLPIKLHAEQLSDQKGAVMAAGLGALSCDHLEYLGDDGVQAMAEAGSVAVMLPGAFYTLRESQLPPIARLREAGVPLAVATDANPGSSPLFSLLTAMNMAATLFRMTPEECLAGVTRHAAQALGMADEVGTIEPGKRADLAIWDIDHPAELAYRIGFNPLHRRVYDGVIEAERRGR